MKTIPTKNGELLCVEVPMDAFDLRIGMFDLYYQINKGGISVSVPVIIGGGRDKFSIIGTITNGVLDFDPRPYVDFNSFLFLLAYHSIEYSGKKLVILSKK